ncbi:MAG: SDR family NAD(P)-dependent oxidoreductase [Simkaniaceae bacterium]|nr:SDR family NAD(P)-dependent oxidoreductase [Candidatus Sacchlamyda saccharinae]
MKNILITGAIRGLGKSLTELLLSKGYSVFGTTRNLKNTTEQKNLKLFYLDFCNKESISNIVDYFRKTGTPLHGIVHNAGIAYLDPVEILDEEEYRRTFEVNFFGPIALTKQLLPNLKKTQKSNLIFISSIVSIDCWPYLGAYAASKRAIEAVAFEWASLLKSWNVQVSIIQPNPLPTDMAIQRSKNVSKSHYPELGNRHLEWESIEETVELIYKILEDEAPRFQYQTGKYSKQTASKFLNEKAYQNSLEENQNHFINLLSSC